MKGLKKFLILFISLFVIVLGGMFLLNALQPQALSSILIAFNMKPTTQEEQQRLAKIDILPISKEKKTLLRNNTIFMGASTVMVRLALGEPLGQENGETPEVSYERWLYHFDDDHRPTILEFQEHKLTSAYKVSAHKIDLSRMGIEDQRMNPAPAAGK